MKQKYDEERKQRYTSVMLPPPTKKIIDSLDYSIISERVAFSNVTSPSALIRRGVTEVLNMLGIGSYEDLISKNLLIPKDKRKKKPGPKKNNTNRQHQEEEIEPSKVGGEAIAG